MSHLQYTAERARQTAAGFDARETERNLERALRVIADKAYEDGATTTMLQGDYHAIMESLTALGYKVKDLGTLLEVSWE